MINKYTTKSKQIKFKNWVYWLILRENILEIIFFWNIQNSW